MRLRSRRRLLRGLLVAPALSVACLGEDPPLGPTDRDDKSDASDAGAPEGSSNDTGVDANKTPGDSGCGHVFCDDFDDDAGLGRWEELTAVGQHGGEVPTIGIDPSGSKSTPASFFVLASAFTYGAVGQIAKSFDVPSNRFENGIRCSFDVRVAERPAEGVNTFVALAVRGSGSPYTVGVQLRDNRTEMYEEAAEAGSLPTALGPTIGGEWTNVTMELHAGAPRFMLKAGEDHTLALKAFPSKVDSYTLKLGMVFGNPYDGTKVRMRVLFDAVRCDRL